jgi:hypothetical protein
MVSLELVTPGAGNLTVHPAGASEDWPKKATGKRSAATGQNLLRRFPGPREPPHSAVTYLERHVPFASTRTQVNSTSAKLHSTPLRNYL